MTQKTLVQQYQTLHDGLSDMIESGRLTLEMIPDDYDWLLLTLLGAMDIAANTKTPHTINDLEMCTIIKGLRCLQRNGGATEPTLSDNEIDILCEELNLT